MQVTDGHAERPAPLRGEFVTHGSQEQGVRLARRGHGGSTGLGQASGARGGVAESLYYRKARSHSAEVPQWAGSETQMLGFVVGRSVVRFCAAVKAGLQGRCIQPWSLAWPCGQWMQSASYTCYESWSEKTHTFQRSGPSACRLADSSLSPICRGPERSSHLSRATQPGSGVWIPGPIGLQGQFFLAGASEIQMQPQA